MKKILFAGIASLALVGCTAIEETEYQGRPKSGSDIVFEGGFAMTKISYSDPVDGVYNLSWTEGDAIGIFSLDQTETMNDNIKAELSETSIGMSKGLFVPIDEIIVIPPVEEGGEPTEIVEKLEFPETSDETFLVYYPYSKGTTIDVLSGGIKSSVAKVQKQDALGDRKLGVNGFSTALASVKAGSGKATFNLTHNMAYICFKASSTEFAGYQLHSVQLFDSKKEAELSGEFIYDLGGKGLVVGEKTGWSATVQVSNHDFASAPSASELYLTVLPGDYSSAEMFVVVTFINEKGETATVPMKLDKACKFPAGSLTTIDLGDVTTARNAYSWYEPFESRDLLGYYAYGHTNTYYAEHIARADSVMLSTKVEIDVKARGDFSRVAEPRYYGLVVPSEMGDAQIGLGTRYFLSTDGKRGGSSCSRDNYRDVIDGKIEVYVLDLTAGTGRWGTVGIYDENFDLLWSFLIVSYQTGDEPKDVVYKEGFTLMDRYLGQFWGNAAAAEKGNFDTSGGPVLPFFQWGRKDPFAWTNTNGLAFYTSVAYDDDTTIETGIKNPTTHLAYVKGNATVDTNGDWQAEGIRTDLWGGYNNAEKSWYDPEEKGHKTVFDPCPDGYRVPDSKVFKAVGDNAEIWEAANGHKLQVTDPGTTGYHLNPESPFYAAGFSVLAYKLADGTYDYWYWAGYSNDGEKFAGRSSNSKNSAIEVWSNAVSNEDSAWNARACCLEYGYWSSAIQFNARHSARKAYRYPVRCQKED